MFKESEFDKITTELLHEVCPTDVLNKYYFLGVAEAMNTITKILEGAKAGKIDANELKTLISKYVNQNEAIATYYARLQNDGAK